MLLLCYRYTGNLMDAEEVMHNGFLKIFANLKKFKSKHEKGFEFWVRKIMVNESLMFLRKNTNFRLVTIEESKAEEATEIITDLSLEGYLEVIKELPSGYRTVFNLFAIEGYSHKEIAGMLKISESTSRSQLTKARKLLQQKINKDERLYAG